MDLQPQLSSVNQPSRKTPPVMISLLLAKWKGGGMPEQSCGDGKAPLAEAPALIQSLQSMKHHHFKMWTHSYLKLEAEKPHLNHQQSHS